MARVFRAAGAGLLWAAMVAACDDGAAEADAASAPDLSIPHLPDAGRRRDADPDATPGTDGVAPAAPDAFALPPEPVAVETRLGLSTTPAGLENRITCEVLDAFGQLVDGGRTSVELFPEDGWARTDVGFAGQVARDYRAVCVAPDVGLRDAQPAIWTVSRGPPAWLVAELEADAVDAGGEVRVTCRAFDAFGNETQAFGATVKVDPPPPEPVIVIERRLRLRGAGAYAVSCVAPGADSAAGASLTVRPGPPASLAVRAEPERRVHGRDEVVELSTIVADALGNPIRDAPLRFTASGGLSSFGPGRYVTDVEGRHRLTARVDDPGVGAGLEASAEILVDFGGPGIACERPEPDTDILLPADGAHDVSGRVSDAVGARSVEIDGEAAALGPDGRWSVRRPARWGLNVHDVVAVDEADHQSSTFCAYAASGAWLDESAPLADAVVLRLGQAALDDGPPSSPLRSLGDVVRRVVNSRGLRDTIHQALSAQNPLLPDECRQRVLGLCVFRLGLTYRDVGLDGPHDVALTLIDGGLRVRATLRALRVAARIEGTLSRDAGVSTSEVVADLRFDVDRRADGNPGVALRSVDELSLGRLDADFGGFLGGLFELVFGVFEGLIRRTLTAVVRDYLSANVDAVLEGLLGNLDIGALAQGFDVPSLGGAPIRLSVAARLSTLDFAAGRALIGLETRVDGPTRLAGRSRGVALPPGAGRPDPPANRPVGAGVQLAVLDQALHRLWRAGFFELDGAALARQLGGALPAGVQIGLSLARPPMAIGEDGRTGVRLDVGPATATVLYPGLFDTPLSVRLAARVSASVSLRNGRALEFGEVSVDALHLGFEGLAAGAGARAREVLEDALTRVLQRVVDAALAGALPALPLPELVIPADFAAFDLPAGGALGLRDVRLEGAPARWTLDGRFGE